jgi:hypothetical protein
VVIYIHKSMNYVRSHGSSRYFLHCGEWYSDSRVSSVPGFSHMCYSRLRSFRYHRYVNTMINDTDYKDPESRRMIYTETISDPKMPRTGQVLCQGQTQQACGLQGCCNNPDGFFPSICTTSMWTNISRRLWKVLHLLNDSRPQFTPRSHFQTSLLR